MEQVDVHYIAALIAALEGAERPLERVRVGEIEIVWQPPAQPAPQEPPDAVVSGFKPSAAPPSPVADNSPGAMHRRLGAMPDFIIQPPTRSE